MPEVKTCRMMRVPEPETSEPDQAPMISCRGRVPRQRPVTALCIQIAHTCEGMDEPVSCESIAQHTTEVDTGTPRASASASPQCRRTDAKHFLPLRPSTSMACLPSHVPRTTTPVVRVLPVSFDSPWMKVPGLIMPSLLNSLDLALVGSPSVGLPTPVSTRGLPPRQRVVSAV